ncbi:MAG: hypothetical protein SangKO_017910 [Sandaracinaceae bacterium]
MAVAEVVGRAEQPGHVRAPGRRQRLERGDDPDHGAVTRAQAVAAAKDGAARKEEPHVAPICQARSEPAPLAVAEGEGELDARGAVGIEDIFMEDIVDFEHREPPGRKGRGQNKKYRWAIGSTSAGSQVRSTPSARTS